MNHYLYPQRRDFLRGVTERADEVYTRYMRTANDDDNFVANSIAKDIQSKKGYIYPQRRDFLSGAEERAAGTYMGYVRTASDDGNKVENSFAKGIQWTIFVLFFCLFNTFLYCCFLGPVRTQLKTSRRTEKILRKQVQTLNQTIPKQSILLKNLYAQIKPIAFSDTKHFQRYIFKLCKYFHFKNVSIKLAKKPPVIQAELKFLGKTTQLKKLSSKLKYSRLALKNLDLYPKRRDFLRDAEEQTTGTYTKYVRMVSDDGNFVVNSFAKGIPVIENNDCRIHLILIGFIQP